MKSVKGLTKAIDDSKGAGSLMPEDDQNLETVMGLIMNGGNAKSSAFEAIHAAKGR